VDSTFVLPVELMVDSTPLRIMPTTELQTVIITDFSNISFNMSPAYFAIKEVKKHTNKKK
jgi:hypothetical protein